MNRLRVRGALSVAAALSLAGTTAYGQGSGGAAEAHLAAARKAAGQQWESVMNRVCGEAVPPATPPAPAARPAAPRPPGPPDRSTWHAEPVRVFDNLYFLGQTEYSVWAVSTSEGFILVDTIYDYSVEDEVVGGMKKLGLDPAKIKYVIVSHGHSDHSGGARFLQDTFGARVILSAADWDLLDRSSGTKPRRDMVATDGMKITLGDTTLTLHLTPGHTLGTISTLIPVKDHGRSHLVAEWGGTAFNWVRSPATYVTAERPAAFWFQTYSDSARRFRAIAAHHGADVLISNHTDFDGSRSKIPLLATRRTGEPHPFVVGRKGVQGYLTVVDECAKAGLARTRASY